MPSSVFPSQIVPADAQKIGEHPDSVAKKSNLRPFGMTPMDRHFENLQSLP
jgi:hypothetical protein